MLEMILGPSSHHLSSRLIAATTCYNYANPLQERGPIKAGTPASRHASEPGVSEARA